MTIRNWDRLDVALVVALVLAAIVVVAATPAGSSAQGWGVFGVVCAQIIRYFAFKAAKRHARTADENDSGSQGGE
jgi:protein-S-isoprenylcysteine O-methyltransferase Ste14